MNESWDTQLATLGAFIRSRRKLADLSLRQLADMTKLSNPYLSQIERGLHQPSVRVIQLISDVLNVSAETLLAQAGLIRQEAGTDTGQPPVPAVEAAIHGEERLSQEQKNALIIIFHGMLQAE